MAEVKISCKDKEGKEQYSLTIDSTSVDASSVQDPELQGPATLMDILINNDIPVGSSCGGHGMCHWCKLTVINGADLLTGHSKSEGEALDKGSLKDKQRLSCQLSFKDGLEGNGELILTAGYW